MSASPLKILVSGDVRGNFKSLFSRVSNIEKKNGKFDLLLCVGDFFGDNNDEWDKYVQKELKVPISVLILGANQECHCSLYGDKEGAELCDNVTFLGKRGLYTGSSGLQIAYLSGTESAKSSEVYFSRKDVDELVQSAASSKQFKGVDILITSQWAKGVEKYASEVDSLESDKNGSSLIAKLAVLLRPRYHFVGLQGVFYERQPYRNHQVLQETAHHVTRYIGLAKVGNADKKKYLYAFSITPLTAMDKTELIHQPKDVTECPYPVSEMKAEKPLDSDSQQFFFDMKPSKDKGDKRQRKNEADNQRKKQKHAQPMGPCWFCLRGDKVEKHLVVSVGETTYLALAKGGLVPDHVLILPIGHYQSTVTAPPETIEEIEKYKCSLKKFFKSIGKAVVFFERNFKTSHLQIQVVPVPLDKSCNVLDAFQEFASEEKVDLNEIPQHSDLKQIVRLEMPYFFAEVPTGEKLLCRIGKFFQLQFGREVMSSPMLLNMPERIDWKKCNISEDEEKQNAASFKQMYRPFDFNFT